MNAKIENGKLTLTAPVSQNPPYSKTGKSRIGFSTNGFVSVQSDDGKTYQLSINLIVKGSLTFAMLSGALRRHFHGGKNMKNAEKKWTSGGGDAATMVKYYGLSDGGNAVLSGESTCPICGCDALDGDTKTWDFLSGVYNRVPLVCGHGWLWVESTDPDDASALWEDSVVVFKEFVPELEKLGYEELE